MHFLFSTSGSECKEYCEFSTLVSPRRRRPVDSDLFLQSSMVARKFPPPNMDSRTFPPSSMDSGTFHLPSMDSRTFPPPSMDFGTFHSSSMDSRTFPTINMDSGTFPPLSVAGGEDSDPNEFLHMVSFLISVINSEWRLI